MSGFITALTKTLVTAPKAAAIAVRPAKVLMAGISLGALLTVSNSVEIAQAQKLHTAREQAIRECNRMYTRSSHEPWEGTKIGGRYFVYKACKADHGQVE
jgi:hypothetical protein